MAPFLSGVHVVHPPTYAGSPFWQSMRCPGKIQAAKLEAYIRDAEGDIANARRADEAAIGDGEAP